MTTLVTKSPDDTKELAAQIAPLLRPGDFVLLAGDLGAGKTAFTQGLGRALGITEPITSPTFTLVRVYDGQVRLVHVDVYRLDYIQEITDLAITELVDDQAIAVVEWGDVAEAVLPPDYLELQIAYAAGDEERRILMHAVGWSWSARQTALERAVDRWRVDG
jgi:tRNA threonylcarbamoyladenosine biosynthesis protein TsaE